MSQLEEHPAVRRWRQRGESAPARPAVAEEARWLRELAREAGADDVGFVAIDRPEIADQREDILAVFPAARSLMSFVCRLSRENIRSPARTASNLEFHHVGDHVNEIARRIVAAAERRGIRAMNPAMGFPMETDRFPDRKIWIISHKPVAVAAGLGQMGIHRNVIHPVFGSFVLLGTVVLDVEVDEESTPLSYNPCLECKLCVAACPVGAIGTDGSFNFSACYTHNYREFLGGFSDWVETIAQSRTAIDYRRRMSDSETVSVWQSLSFGPNYKSAYCMSVCPAGDEVLAPFMSDRAGFLRDVVRPLQEKRETVYVVPGSDAESHVRRRFPHKRVKRVGNGLRPRSLAGFLRGLQLTFQRGPAEKLDATYHFAFSGSETRDATVRIRNGTLEIYEGHVGKADLRVSADTASWLGFLARERSLVWALLTRRIRLRGSPALLVAFGRCFPSGPPKRTTPKLWRRAG